MIHSSNQICLGERNIPSDIFSIIAQFTFGQPTHPEEIPFQDKKVLSFRLVCKQWNNFFSHFLYSRVHFDSMKVLFVHERNWPSSNFIKIYQERINYLKKLRLTRNSENYLKWIEAEELQIKKYSQEPSNEKRSDQTSDSLFDWAIISNLGHCSNLETSPELSYEVFYRYLLIERGFICDAIMNKLETFFLEELDRLIKDNKDKRLSSLPKALRELLYTLYCNKELPRLYQLNMNYADFLAKIPYCDAYDAEAHFLSKQLFKDFHQFSPPVIDYEDFIQSICSIPFRPIDYCSGRFCSKQSVAFFLKQFRAYFTRNDFEGRRFLYYLLQYRLQFHTSLIDSDLDHLRKWRVRALENLDQFTLAFFKEFWVELKGCSMPEKEEYSRLFYSNSQPLTIKQVNDYNWALQVTHLKKKQYIGFYVDALLAHRFAWILPKIKLIYNDPDSFSRFKRNCMYGIALFLFGLFFLRLSLQQTLFHIS